MASDGYLRFPHLQGDLLTFIAEDDVWLAPVSGGRPWRLTTDRAQAGWPRLARDGSTVAWTGSRDGPPEVYVASLEGGDGRRLTFWGDYATRVRGWSPDGEVLVVTAAGQPFDHYTWAHAVRPDGGMPRRLEFGPVSDLAVERDAVALLTGRHPREPAYWKRYRGGCAGRLWLGRGGQDAPAPFSRLAESLGGQFDCPMIVGGRLAFLADHEGTANLYSCDFNGDDLRRHTDHDGFYARHASTDGRRVVYQCAGDIWLLGDLDGEARPLDIRLGSPGLGRRPGLVSAEDHLGDLSCDYTGKASAVEVRGSVHWLTHKDGPARALAVTPRARLPRVLGRTGQVVWVSDTDAGQALEIAPAGAAAGQPRRLAAGEFGRAEELAAAPDGGTVAIAARDGRLFLVDVVSGEVSELAAAPDGPAGGLAFSPDSAWLAWSQPGPRPLTRIRLARLHDRTLVDVTDGRFTDTDPVFTLDGRYLAFLSWRSFDPVYDAHFFDLSFPFGCRPYLVPLAADTPSPFAPLPDGRPASQADGGDGGDDREAGQVTVTVDAGGLAGRVVQVPVPEARYSDLQPVKGGIAWLSEPLTGTLGEGTAELDGSRPRASLERFDLDKRRCTELVAELDWFDVSGDGTRMVVSDRDDLRVVSAERKDDSDGPGDTVSIDLSRARFMADPATLWRHAYGEAGRIMRHDFWVADMSDVAWDEILDQYRPLLDRIAGSDDFADLLWEVFGELNTSHAYVREAPTHGGGENAGMLGVDLDGGTGGRWRIARVLPGESSDPRARSPLAAPGVVVRPGDSLIAVDGQPVDPVTGPGPLLAGAAGVPVELTLAPADGGEARRVVVVPLADEDRLRYQDWVASRRSLVRELGGGRIGYLHVPDMMGAGWAHFHRDLRLEMTHGALIVDVRGNRGGHVSQLVVEKLARRVLGWSVPRWLRPMTYPRDAPRGPLITVTDEFAGSDGDIVTAAIHGLGLGPIVGARTWGGVVGMDGEGHRLVDGTWISVPRYATWLDGYGWNLENRGAEPDVEVLNSPDDWAAGRDCQLEAAVQLALEALTARPPLTTPDTSQRPAKRRPPLPPR
ncbi:MAG TPA: PDZ domain-containing protein [Streptosporangiaceae bacterium]